jgi:hypothetical protein
MWLAAHEVWSAICANLLALNAYLVDFGCLFRGDIISWGLIGVFHSLPPASPLDVVLEQIPLNPSRIRRERRSLRIRRV